MQEHYSRAKEKSYFDIPCSNHMKENKNLFKSSTDYDGESTRFGDNSNKIVIGIETISFDKSCEITNIYLLKDLKYNL